MPRLHTREEDLGFIGGEVATGGATVALLNATVAGFSILRDRWLSCLYVAAPARGCGLGSSLLQQAQARGPLSLWCFQANEPALAFYRRHGLTETARTDGADNAERLPDIRLESPGLPGPGHASPKVPGPLIAPPPHFSGRRYSGGSGGQRPPAGGAAGGGGAPRGPPRGPPPHPPWLRGAWGAPRAPPRPPAGGRPVPRTPWGIFQARKVGGEARPVSREAQDRGR
ncbi:GNAT family N-acetyltransferase [Histidinibacterium lentulum]